jgi:hypothetical protein
MPSDREIANLLIKHFNTHGWPVYVDEDKLLGRYSIASDEVDQNHAIVEIERHHAIAGAHYEVGQGMSAFATYYMRYRVDLHTGAVDELSDRYEGFEIDIREMVEHDLDSSCFDVTISSIDSGHYVVFDEFSRTKATISALDEMVQFYLSFLDDKTQSFRESLSNTDSMDSAEMDRHAIAYRESMRKALEERAQAMWEERDD